MTVFALCTVTVIAQAPQIVAPPGWSSELGDSKVILSRKVSDGLGNAVVTLMTENPAGQAERELLSRGIILQGDDAPAFTFLNSKGAKFTARLVNVKPSSNTVLLSTPSGDGFKSALVELPSGGPPALMNEVSGIVGPWLSNTSSKSGQWRSPDGKSGSSAQARGSGDDTFTIVDGNAGDGWSWSSASSSSSSSQSSSDRQSSSDTDRSRSWDRQQSSDRAVVIDPGSGQLKITESSNDPAIIEPGRMTLHGKALRLPNFPRDEMVTLDLARNGSFSLHGSGKDSPTLKGRCVQTPNGYRLVDSGGKPTGLTMQIVLLESGPAVTLNGLLLRRS